MSGTKGARAVSRRLVRRNRFHSLVAALVAAAVATSGCRSPAQTTPRPHPEPIAAAPAPAPPSTARKTVPFDATGPEEGALLVELPDPRIAAAGVSSMPLTPAETQALLARLEPLPAGTATAAPPVRPPSLPPPRGAPAQPLAFVVPTGKPVAEAPIGGRGAVAQAALAVPQILPDGAVRADAEIRVRFAEPMVPVAAVGAAPAPPITIAPPVAGSWRWIDTRVLAFTPAGPRLPQATKFEVTVRAGARAVSGAVLPADVVGAFETAPVQIHGRFPTTLRPDSPIAVELDQDIDPTKLAAFLRVETTKGKRLAVRVIGRDEALASWAKNPSLPADLGSRLGARHVILAPVGAWPAGVDAQVILAKGAPSAEGPLPAHRETFATFSVVPPFTIRGITCTDVTRPRRVARCPAQSYLSIELSTPVDKASFRSSKFQIAGEPLQDMTPRGTSVSLWTPEAVGRRYTIPVGDELVDIYGQPLTGPRALAFTTTPERFWPMLHADTGLHILDPRFAIPQWVLYTQAVSRLRVQLYQVTPADYFEYASFEAGKRKTPPGRRVYDKLHTIGTNHGAHARVDLRPALNTAGLGHVIAFAEVTPAPGRKLDPTDRRAIAWIQVTRLGASARIDGERINAWVHDISPTQSFLAPSAGITTGLLVDGHPSPSATATSDATGHVAFELPAPGTATPRRAQRQRRAPSGDDDDDDDDDDAYYDYRPDALLTLTSANDSAFTAISAHEKAIRQDAAYWYVTDDRFTYKPGETVYLKGWVRWTHSGPNPDLSLPAAGDTVAFQLDDARGNKVAQGTAPLSPEGGFDLEVALPANVNLGTARFSLSTRKQMSWSHPIQIEEFRTPAYFVTLDDDVTHKGATPLILGERIEMSAEAAYYAGGGLAGAGVRWRATMRSTAYRPPGWDPFAFTPPRTREDLDDWRWRQPPSVHASSAGSLSGASSAGVVYGVTALAMGRPAVLTVEATVTDLDRQTIRAASREIPVHPSQYYVGLRQQPNATDRLEAIVTDIDGAPVAGVPIAIELEGVLASERYRDDAKIVDTQRCELVSGTAAVACPWRRKDLKTTYLATAKIADPRGRANATQYQVPWIGRDDTRTLSLAPDRASYRPGDVARIEILSKVVPASAVVTFARQGVITQRRVELTAASTFVELPIEPAFIQNVHVIVDRLGKREHQQGKHPRPLPEHVSAQLELPVDLDNARLVMTARSTRSLIEPGARATFEVEVRHADRPMPDAEVALMVVDEAVLALSDRSHPDPLPRFYRKVGARADGTNTLGLVRDSGDDLAGDPGFVRHDLRSELGGVGSGYGAGGGGMSARTASVPKVSMGSAMVTSRKDFRPTAVFSPTLRTGPDGKVRLSVTMPDNLTRYRVVAIAAAKTRLFGKAESTLVAQRKLNARIVAPRFLSQGDRFSLPVVIQNLDAAPRTIDVAVRAANLVTAGPAGKRLTVPGGQRAEVRFELATARRGTAVIQAIASAGAVADAMTTKVPVYEPATTESFATYGVVDDAPRFERLEIPKDIFPEVGGAELEVTSTQVAALTDAYWYLYAYPYECAEQRSGRMLATAALGDLLDAFATPGRPTRAQIADQIALDVRRLEKQQLRDGGWGYFRGMEADPFVTMQVLAALVAHEVKGRVVTDATAYVTKQATSLLAALEASAKLPPVRRTRREATPYDVSLAAAALGTLERAGVDVRTRARRLHAAATTLGSYPVDAKARILALLAGHPASAAIRKQLLASLVSTVHETAAAAHVTARYVEAERLLLVSTTKTTALVLDALIREAPDHALIVKLARGVLDSRRHGRWRSTQENLAALEAMRRYFDVYEKATPNFTGKLWLGTKAYAEQPFVGRTTARGAARVDWATLPAGSAHDLALVKDGPGRMYYRLGITYAPRRIDLPALDAGFIVRRAYTAIDAPTDVTRLPDGRTRVRLGARVLVTVEAVTSMPRFGVAIVDPLPAGFEAINERLATSERGVVVEQAAWDFRNLRDNRSEVFAMRLAPGTHVFAYAARATVPGTFMAAPAKAEEMYSPETFGRSTGTAVVIE